MINMIYTHNIHIQRILTIYRKSNYTKPQTDKKEILYSTYLTDEGRVHMWTPRADDGSGWRVRMTCAYTCEHRLRRCPHVCAHVIRFRTHHPRPEIEKKRSDYFLLKCSDVHVRTRHPPSASFIRHRLWIAHCSIFNVCGQKRMANNSNTNYNFDINKSPNNWICL